MTFPSISPYRAGSSHAPRAAEARARRTARLGHCVAALCAFVAMSLAGAGPVHAMNLMALGDSLAEGLCANGGTTGATADCVNPYGTNPAYAAELGNYTAYPDFCTTFAQSMVENFNPGNDKGGFRGPLLGKLRSAGTTVTMKGHVKSGSTLALADRAHEGHGAWETRHINYCVGGYMTAQNPDTVLLEIGTNDLLGTTAVTTIADNIMATKTTIGSARRLLIASVPAHYVASGANYVRDTAFETRRKALAQQVADRSNFNYPCTARNLPDMSVLKASEMNNGSGAGLHPNNAGYERMAEIWKSSLLTPECQFDTRTFVTIGGILMESITAYGRYWLNGVSATYHESGTLNTPDIARYQSICDTHPVCTFDTRLFIDGPSGPQESITAFNWIYNYTSAGALQSSSALRSVTRYNTYICTYAAPNTCVFDTRAIRSGSVETITAYGRYFDFNQSTGAYIGSGLLTGVSRYVPICNLKPASQTYCTFDTRTYVQLPGIAQYIESITAYGRYWNFDAATGALLDSGTLASVASYKHP